MTVEIDENVLKYITKEAYLKSLENLKIGEYRKIYEDEVTLIEVTKQRRKIYTFINTFTGKKTLNEALNNIVNLAV